MNVDEFVSAHDPSDDAARFRLENDKLLAATVDDPVVAKAGAMVAYTGDLTFSGRASAEGGLTGFVKDAVTSEGTPVMDVEGDGTVYLADGGKKVQVFELEAGESLSVNGEDVLAFDAGVSYEIGTIGSLAGSQTGGLTNVFLEGPGYAAVTTHGDPLVLRPPVKTDPAATVAWSGSAAPELNVNKSLSDFVGSSSDETYQLEFTGEEGFVVVQPFEERPPQ